MVALTVQQNAWFKKRFAELDNKEPYGTLDKEECKALIREYSEDANGNPDADGEKYIAAFLASFDKDGEAGISFVEFMKFVNTVAP